MAKDKKLRSNGEDIDNSVRSSGKSRRGRGKSPTPSSRGKSPKGRGKSPKRDKSPSTRKGKKKELDDPSKKTVSSGGKTKKTTKMSDSSVRSEHSASITPENVLDVIPQEYYRNPEPLLHYLPKMVNQSKREKVSNSKGQLASSKFPNLRVLLQAAEDDIRLHRARLQAAKARDASLLRSYKIETDQNWLARQQRLNERELMLSKLDTERAMILKELTTETKGLTNQEKTQVQLARWQRLLDLYVYMPQNNDEGLDFLGVLKNLLEGIAEVSVSSVNDENTSIIKTLMLLFELLLFVGG